MLQDHVDLIKSVFFFEGF